MAGKTAPVAEKPIPTARAGRSPAYPAFDLQTAIDKVSGLYETQRTNSVHLQAALTTLGYKSLSGTSQRAIAALISYGLLSEDGKGDTRKVRVAELARKILIDNPAKQEAIREAALKPKIYNDMVEEWPETLPSDDAIKPYLIFEKGYHEDSVPGLIRDFRATYEFAKLGNQGTITPDKSDRAGTNTTQETEKIPEPDPFVPRSERDTKLTGSPSHQPDTRTLTIPMPKGREALLRIPADLSEEDFKFLTAYLGLMRDALIGSVSEATEAQAMKQLNVRIGPAIWHAKDADRTIMVSGYKGQMNGKHYVSIEDSDIGVPMEEVEYESSSN